MYTRSFSEFQHRTLGIRFGRFLDQLMHPMNRMVQRVSVLLCFVSLALSQGLPSASPDEVGLSADRLARISKAMEEDVAAGRIPGALATVIRKGKVAYQAIAD